MVVEARALLWLPRSSAVLAVSVAVQAVAFVVWVAAEAPARVLFSDTPAGPHGLLVVKVALLVVLGAVQALAWVAEWVAVWAAVQGDGRAVAQWGQEMDLVGLAYARGEE